MIRRASLAIGVVAIGLAPIGAFAQPEIGGYAERDYFSVLSAEARDGAEQSGRSQSATRSVVQRDLFERRIWTPACIAPDAPQTPQDFALACPPANVVCPPDQQLFRQWGLRDGVWTRITEACRGELPEAEAPEVTPAMVLRALRRLGLPEVEARTQPEGTTLVNFDTIFYAEATTQTRTVTLLGQPVTIEAEPVEFTWHPGDGTTRTTTTPGAPYPATDVTHRYATATDDDPLRPHVDVTYRARYRLADGPWQPITETVTITGPPGTLRVAEATPALTR